MTRTPPRLAPPPGPDFVVDRFHREEWGRKGLDEHCSYRETRDDRAHVVFRDPCHGRRRRLTLRVAIGALVTFGVIAVAWGLS